MFDQINGMQAGPAKHVILPATARRQPVLRVTRSGAAEVLATITQPDVKLAIWERQTPFSLRAAVVRDFASLRFVSGADSVARYLARLFPPGLPSRDAIIADVDDLACRFAAIIGCAAVEIRLDRIEGDACWKFHADYVSVRLLCTYLGQGTQWLRNQDVTQPQQLETGAVGLFKGRERAPDDPVIHRSPPIAGTGERRLLLVIDPADGPPAT